MEVDLHLDEEAERIADELNLPTQLDIYIFFLVVKGFKKKRGFLTPEKIYETLKDQNIPKSKFEKAISVLESNRLIDIRRTVARRPGYIGKYIYLGSEAYAKMDLPDDLVRISFEDINSLMYKKMREAKERIEEWVETKRAIKSKKPRDTSYEYDIFISHAWEDKKTIARPLAQALLEIGLKVWYDKFILKLGDSLRRSIDHGLSKSRYGIVILSPHFFEKEWPQRELDGLVAREVSSGKVILPIWHFTSACRQTGSIYF